MTTADRHPTRSRKRDMRGPRNFARLLSVIAVTPFVLGAWGTWQGLLTKRWPLAEGQILGSDMRLFTSERRGNDGRTLTDTRAAVDVRYTYSVGGRDYSGHDIAPYSYGMQNSAEARHQSQTYRPGTPVKIAYNPSDPSIAYLEAGPSSVSLMFLGIGTVIGLAGLWVRNLAKRGIGRMTVD